MWMFYSAVKAVFDLKRTCRHCKHSQLIKLNSRGKTVKCNRCGRDIPAPKTHDLS